MALFVSANMVSTEGRMNARGVVTGDHRPTMQLAQDDAPATTDTCQHVHGQRIPPSGFAPIHRTFLSLHRLQVLDNLGDSPESSWSAISCWYLISQLVGCPQGDDAM